MAPQLSISIVNWNTRVHLERCLDALREGCGEVTAEIIVVDNASTDGSLEMIRRKFPEIRLLALPENIGFAAANNLALHESSGRYVLLLNPDIYAPPGSIQQLIDFLETRPYASGVGATLVGLDGRVQAEFYRLPPSLMQIVLFYTVLSYGARWFGPLRRRYFEADLRKSNPVAVEQLPGACCLVRRRVLEEVGLLDPDFFIWFEDVDWCYRMRQANHELYALPETRLIHAGGASFKGWSVDRRITQFFLSLFRFLCKHHHRDRLTSWAHRIISADLFVKESMVRFLARSPFSSESPMPNADALRALRRSICEVMEQSRNGALVRFSGGPMSFEPMVQETARLPLTSEKR